MLGDVAREEEQWQQKAAVSNVPIYRLFPSNKSRTEQVCAGE